MFFLQLLQNSMRWLPTCSTPSRQDRRPWSLEHSSAIMRKCADSNFLGGKNYGMRTQWMGLGRNQELKKKRNWISEKHNFLGSLLYSCNEARAEGGQTTLLLRTERQRAARSVVCREQKLPNKMTISTDVTLCTWLEKVRRRQPVGHSRVGDVSC